MKYVQVELRAGKEFNLEFFTQKNCVTSTRIDEYRHPFFTSGDEKISRLPAQNDGEYQEISARHLYVTAVRSGSDCRNGAEKQLKTVFLPEESIPTRINVVLEPDLQLYLRER